MTRTADELLAEALVLSEEARAQLARSLIASLDEAEQEVHPDEIEDAWLAEVLPEGCRDRCRSGEHAACG